MINLMLFVKAFNKGQLQEVTELLQTQFQDLDVSTHFFVNPDHKWVQVALEGEDETIATAFIRKEIGICPVSLENVDVDSILRGFVAKVDESSGKLYVDLGVFEPKISLAVVPLSSLRTQFLVPKESTIKSIAEAYGITEGLPIYVKVTANDENLEVELALEQVEKFKAWQQSLLGRLIILRSSKRIIETTLKRVHLHRDIIEVEQLGFFEFALTCKLGTDARGLVPKVGRYMRNAVFVVFTPRKISGF